MTQVINTQTIIPSNPADREVILDAIKEADASLIRIDAEKDQVVAIIDEIHEKYKLNKGLIRKLINTYHKQNFNVVEQELDDFIKLYESIVK